MLRYISYGWALLNIGIQNGGLVGFVSRTNKITPWLLSYIYIHAKGEPSRTAQIIALIVPIQYCWKYNDARSKLFKICQPK